MKNILLDIKTPMGIELESFSIIERELMELHLTKSVDFGSLAVPPFQGGVWEVARRIVHTTADYSILNQLYIPEHAVEAGVNALLASATILTDTEMARAGMVARRLEPLGVVTACLHKQLGVDDYAKKYGCTKARAGIMLACGMDEERVDRTGEKGAGFSGKILAIGNAPTAIIALLDCLNAGILPPALIIAMPVGFVNAAESKELLLEYGLENCIVLRGRRGGSPLVSATINALAEIALKKKQAEV